MTDTNTTGTWLATTVKTLGEQAAALTELRIVTAVGSVTLETVGDDAGRPQQVISGTAKAMESRIGLVSGDTTTLMDTAFVTGDYQSVRAFHEAQVGNGRQIVTDNIAAVRSLIGLLDDLWVQSRQTGEDPAGSEAGGTGPDPAGR